MNFELENFHRDIPSDELLADLRHAYEQLSTQGRTMSFRSYAEIGRFSAGTLAERFGSWNKALIAAGLKPISEKNISVAALFENLRQVWVAKGKQPVFRDMAAAPSRYKAQLYAARFGSWRNALREFIKYVKSEDWLLGDESVSWKPLATKRTGRDITLRLRFRILLRDNFKCQSCGASPANEPGVELHVDHVLPWSKGGETEESNLQTKCNRCNLGKGAAFNR